MLLQPFLLCSWQIKKSSLLVQGGWFYMRITFRLELQRQEDEGLL